MNGKVECVRERLMVAGGAGELSLKKRRMGSAGAEWFGDGGRRGEAGRVSEGTMGNEEDVKASETEFF